MAGKLIWRWFAIVVNYLLFIYYLCGKDMKIMKIILLLLSIFTVATASAESLLLPFEHAEPARGEVVPYGRAADALKAEPSASNYVAKLAQWAISEDGKEYNSSFAVPVWWLNRQVIVRVGRSTSAYEVLVDNRRVGFASSGATPVEFNVTKFAKEGRHSLTIRQVDAEQNRLSGELATLKPLVEGVSVICQPTIRVRDVVCSTTLNDNGEGVAQFSVVVKCDALNAKRARFGYTVHLNDTTVLTKGYSDITLDMRREDTIAFMARIPKNSLWNANNPHLVTLELENRIDNRPVEYMRRSVGVRSVDVVNGVMFINQMPQELKLHDYNPAKSLEEQVSAQNNGLVIPAYYATEALLTQCDKLGILVVVCSAIDTMSLGDHIRVGGNPSNNPLYLATYLSFNRAAYYSTRHHPSVVGYAVAKGKTTGINIYESYLMLKNIEPRLPIVYEGNLGEWCSDKIVLR
jgi:beta-galactosidase